MKKEVPIIETERLFLKGINEENTSFICKLRSNPKVYKFFKNPHKITIEEHLNWYKNNYLYDLNRYDYLACIKDTGCHIGIFGINRIDDNSAEVNYILTPHEQGKGYASEAIVHLLSYIREKWSCKYAIAEIHKDNLQSLMFAKKLGFVKYSTNGDFYKLHKNLTI